ncbi:MAG: alpha/beta hydrolase [Alphaproteobacteria bacterium]|nr:alpha/beta hydrolase [Alphaproteobacteria bacterium]
MMPAVFVHGVPDTPGVWAPTLAKLARQDTIALRLPGFGCALPAGFEPTKDNYAAWLVAELGKLSGPIDLVGHDWGALLCYRALSLEPRLVRSWAAGGAPLDPDYVWHDMAQAWQTPGVGEEVMKQLIPEAMAPGLMAQGQPKEVAEESAGALDATMKAAILSLYRSAKTVGRDWYDDLERIAAPGLVIFGERDPYVNWTFGEKLARHVGARFALIKDCGHWWEAEKPAEVAAALEEFWASL